MKLSSSEITKLALWACLFALLGWLWWYCFEKRVSAVPTVSKAAKENTFLGASRLLKKYDYRVKTILNLEAALDHPLPKGTLYLRNMGGTIEPKQTTVLMNWVEQGNTLIYQPRWTGKSITADLSRRCAQSPLQLSDDINGKIKDDEDDEDDQAEQSDQPASQKSGSGESSAKSSAESSADEKDEAEGEAKDDKNDAKKDKNKDDDEDDTPRLAIDPLPRTRLSSGSLDPISKLLGIELRRVSYSAIKPESKSASNPEEDKKPEPAKALKKLRKKKTTTCPAEVQWPNTNYALQMDHDNLRLFSNNDDKLMLADQSGQALRIYQQGQGHIVVLAEDYFQNAELAYFDHAEVLLKIMGLQAERTVLVIQHLKHEAWYEKLWNHFYLALSACALGLLLLLWISVRRFGAVYPIPEPNRRALLEHIDASSRWLWQVPGGRDILLNAARSLTLKVLQRRAPAIMRLSQTEQIAQLSEICSINRPDLVLALSSGVAPTPLLFIRQIKTLQRLRKHYER